MHHVARLLGNYAHARAAERPLLRFRVQLRPAEMTLLNVLDHAMPLQIDTRLGLLIVQSVGPRYPAAGDQRRPESDRKPKAYELHLSSQERLFDSA
jgi:hypothetical protein